MVAGLPCSAPLDHSEPVASKKAFIWAHIMPKLRADTYTRTAGNGRGWQGVGVGGEGRSSAPRADGAELGRRRVPGGRMGMVDARQF